MIIKIWIAAFVMVINQRIMSLVGGTMQAAGPQADALSRSISYHNKITVHGCHSGFYNFKIIFYKITGVPDLPFHNYHPLLHIVKDATTVVKVRKMTGTITVPAIPLSSLNHLYNCIITPRVGMCKK